MNLKELQAMIKEELDAYVNEQEVDVDVDADDDSFSFGFGIQLNAIKASITKSEKKFFGEKLVFNRAIWTVSFPNK